MRTKLIFFAFIASLVCFSCSNEEDGEFGPSNDPSSNGVDTTSQELPIDGTIFLPVENCIMDYVLPTQELLSISDYSAMDVLCFVIVSKYNSEYYISKKKVKDPDFTLVQDEDGLCHIEFNNLDEIFENEEGYMEYAEFYGDTALNCSVGMGFVGEVFRMPLEGVEITALTDYNDNYPANSSISEIAEMGYVDIVNYIQDGCRDDTLRRINPNEISKENPIRLLSINSGSGKFYMLEKPTPGKHTIQLTLTFGADPVSGETVEPIVLEHEFEYVEYVEE
jgi:hypothetical protein